MNRELDTLQEQRNLIEKLIKSNNKFSGNEDLLEDFCSETFKRVYSLFDSIEPEHIESYVAKVANTAILTVLKDSGRIRRRSNQYVSTREVPISPVPAAKPAEQVSSHTVSATVPSAQVTESTETNLTNVILYDIPDPKDSFEEKIVRKDLLQKVVDIVLVAQKNKPDKEYLKIFYLRYIKEKKQKEIASILNLSQSEISKRLLDIADIVKAHFN